jgi:flagellar FliL protein
MSKDAAPPEGEAPKKKGKLMIIIAALVVVLIGAGAAAFFMMSKPAASKKAKHAGEEEVAAADAEEEEEDAGDHDAHPPVYEKLDQFTVNLTDDAYLQTDIQLLLADVKVQEKIKAHMPEVRDSLIRLLSSKTSEELGQAEGKDKLAKDVQKSINDILHIKSKSKGVKKVLFAAFIIQG